MGPAGRGELVLVATPIGNLGDLSPRAREVLAAADLICCEDTRRTRALLSACGIRAGDRLLSLHGHNERERLARVAASVAAGGTVAVVSDAGTPGISDPGAWLAAQLAAAGEKVTTVPGPSSVIAALVVSGLPTDRFGVEGFLPRKGGERRRRLAALMADERTAVVLEAPGRVAGTLAEMAALDPERPVAVVRELTKLHEEVWRGTLRAAAEEFAAEPRRGEVVLVVGGRAAGRAGRGGGRGGRRAHGAGRRSRGGPAPGGRACGGEPRDPQAARVRGGVAGARSGRRSTLTSGGVRARRYATGGAALLPDHADLLRERRAARRHGVHDGERRRAGARWHRLLGDDVWFMTGTDEHGAKIVEGGRGGRHDAQGVDGPHLERFVEAWRALEISNDDFIRTTEPQHYKVVQEFLQRIYDNGFIELGVYVGLYCVSCEDYYTEDQLVDGKCPVHGRPVIEMSEENYFFKLSAFGRAAARVLRHPPRLRPARSPSATRRSGSSGAVCATCPSHAPRSLGASRCRGTPATSSTSGTTRSSTT